MCYQSRSGYNIVLTDYRQLDRGRVLERREERVLEDEPGQIHHVFEGAGKLGYGQGQEDAVLEEHLRITTFSSWEVCFKNRCPWQTESWH